MIVVKSQNGLFIGKVDGIKAVKTIVYAILSNSTIYLGKYESEERSKEVVNTIYKIYKNSVSYDVVDGKKKHFYNSVFVMPQK